jgi:hypothetical protein
MRRAPFLPASFFLFAGCGGLVALPSEDDDSYSATHPGAEPAAVSAPPDPSVRDGGAGRSDAGDADASQDGNVSGPPLGPPAGAADGVCFAGDVRLGTYDPDCVYVLGTTAPGSSSHDVLFDPADPSRLVSGFGAFQRSLTIRPSDRRLIFTSSSPNQARLFHPTGSAVLPTPACTSQNLRWVLVHPDKGGGLYACQMFPTRYFVLGTSIEFAPTPAYEIVALGPNDSTLVRGFDAFTIIAGGVAHPVTGIAAGKMVAARSRPTGGFFVAVVTSVNDTGRRLWAIATDGAASDLGAYGLPSVQLSHPSALEPSGALVTFAQGDPFGYGVVRLRVDAPPETLFMDTPGQTARLHMPALVTGP